MTLIRVELSAGSHDVLVGPVEAGAERILDLAAGSSPIMISESKVFALHGAPLAEQLAARPILVPEGESAKNWNALHRLLEEMAKQDPDRDTPIVALGGGSVGDLAGLAASLFKRGLPIVHVPTTLLAQADSAVGGKTAIDAFGQKNVIGSFHQPALVVADPDLLDTLDERQLRSGYAEIVKYGLIDDPPFFAWCEANGRGVLAGHRDLRRQAIIAAIRAKARIVSLDAEDRSGRRALLNLGHSFGHAIEAETGIGTLLHGEAVSIGMALAFQFSTELGLCPASDTRRMLDHLSAMGLPTRLAEAGLGGAGSRLVEWMARDKKNKGGSLGLILARGIGQAYVDRSVQAPRLTAFLSEAA